MAAPSALLTAPSFTLGSFNTRKPSEYLGARDSFIQSALGKPSLHRFYQTSDPPARIDRCFPFLWPTTRELWWTLFISRLSLGCTQWPLAMSAGEVMAARASFHVRHGSNPASCASQSFASAGKPSIGWLALTNSDLKVDHLERPSAVHGAREGTKKSAPSCRLSRPDKYEVFANPSCSFFTYSYVALSQIGHPQSGWLITVKIHLWWFGGEGGWGRANNLRPCCIQVIEKMLISCWCTYTFLSFPIESIERMLINRTWMAMDYIAQFLCASWNRFRCTSLGVFTVRLS